MNGYPSLPFVLFSLVFLLCWVILVSFRPPFIRVVSYGYTKPTAHAVADPGKAFSFSFIVAVLALLAIWLCGGC